MVRDFLVNVKDGYKDYAGHISYLPQLLLLVPTLAVMAYGSFFSIAKLVDFGLAVGNLPYDRRFSFFTLGDWTIWYIFTDMLYNLALLAGAAAFLKLLPMAHERWRDKAPNVILQFYDNFLGASIAIITVLSLLAFGLWLAFATVMMIIPALFLSIFGAVLFLPFLVLTGLVNIYAFLAIYSISFGTLVHDEAL